MVRRYNPSHFMKIKAHGDYVAYEDYEKLVEVCNHAYSFMICVDNLDNNKSLEWKEEVTKELKQALKEAENKK